MKTNEDYLHLLEGLEKKVGRHGGHALNDVDITVLRRIQEDVRRMAAPYEGRVMDRQAGDMIRRGVNNILEHYELSYGIHQGRYTVHEAYDEGAYYINLEIQPRQPLEYVTVNIRL